MADVLAPLVESFTDLLESTMKCFVRNTKFFGPSRKALGSSFDREKAVVSFVSTLLLFGSPIAIAGFIIAMIVATFQSQLFLRSWPHIGQEVGKGQPTFANLDSPASVVGKLFVGGTQAASFHGSPNVVFRFSRPTMSSSSFAHIFSGKATATFCQAAFEFAASRNRFASTITNTMPKITASTPASTIQDNQSLEAFANKILESWIGRNKIGGSHDVNLPYRFACGQGRTGFSHPARPVLLYGGAL